MKTIGVDLGTTNSCVYYLDEAGNPVLVIDDRGNGIFPSAAWCAGKGKERVVGHKAKARMGSQPPPVIAVKRKMGTDQKVMLGGELVSPVEVSAEILRHAKKLVESTTHDTIGAVVVTVPAYFDVAPRRDTQLAAVQAFFNGDENRAKGRLELQLEPEAAACAYLAESAAEKLLVLVYDLGGGTFDVTVLEKSPDAGLAAIAFGGDPHLGGDNVDDRLASWISYRIRGGKAEALERLLAPGRYDAENRYTLLQQVLANDVPGLRGMLRPEDRDLLIPDPARYDLELDISNPDDLVRVQKLKWLAENAKKELTVTPEVAIVQQSAFTDHAGELVDIDLDLSLKEFNLLIGDMMAKTIRATLEVVQKSGKQQVDFDRVLLVGGSSRMRVINEELSKIFTCPISLADPDKIVARGAALCARNLSGGAAAAGGLALEYPRQTGDARINIAGRLAQPLEGGRVYLTCQTGGAPDVAVQDVAVQGNSFLLRGVELQPKCENRFRVEVLDAAENIVATQDIRILPGVDTGRPIGKITKPIRYLARSGFKNLFPEGEPLPATKLETCYRAGKENFVSIPIYEGERYLRELRIPDIDPGLNIGAEIKFSITIERDYNVRAGATISSTGQKTNVEFRIEPIRMPTLEELERDKESTIEEIENGLEIVKDRNKLAQFRRAVRRLEAEFLKARKANEPDCHHLFTLVGELKKIKTEVDKSQEFLTPPQDEFSGVIRVCRNRASKLDVNAAVSKEEILEKISALEAAGKDAWEHENKPEWQQVNKEAKELLASLEEPPPPARDIPPEAIASYLLDWLTEIAGKVKKQQLEDQFDAEIEDLRSQVRAVDLRDKEAAREKLLKIVREKIKPLEQAVKEAGAEVGTGLVQ